MNNNENPFRAAGMFTGVSYIERNADKDLRNSIEKNQRYPYILAPRQSGKSSLIENTIAKLCNYLNYNCIFIDLSEFALSSIEKYNQFLLLFCKELLNQLKKIGIKIKSKPGNNLKSLIEEIAKNVSNRVVIFIDEVDKLLDKTFKDDFFGLIRAFFNQRSRNHDLIKIQFVLSGAAQPTQLITNQYSSPFNVGEPIKLENLSEQQIAIMLKYCDFIPESEIQLTSSIIYSYTNGSVYLTQLILENLWNTFFEKNLGVSQFSSDIIKYIVDIIKDRCQENAHFLNIYNNIMNDRSLLEAFRAYVETKTINNISYAKLKIIGIIDSVNNNPYQNQIYKEVFGETGKLPLLERKLNPLSSSNDTKIPQTNDQDPPTKMQSSPTEEKQLIPKNRIKRIEKEFSSILNKKIKEGKNKTFPLAWNTNKQFIERAFERLALGMETLQKNIITDEEFEQLVSNFYSKENLECFSILEKKIDSDNKNRWSFRITYLQEYLAARILAKQPLSIIKKFIALPPNQKYINSFWTNTLPFLVSLIDTNSEKEKFEELLDWIKEVSPNLIINFEPTKIDITVRLDYVKAIIEKYKDKRLRNDYDYDYYAKLAYFGQSDSLITYLLEAIKTTEDSKYLHKSSNCLDILRHLTIPHNKKSLTTQTLINCALSSPLGNYIQYKAITALTDLKLHTKEIVMRLIHNFKSSNNLLLRQGLYYVLYNSDYLESNIDIFLDGFKYASYTKDEYSKHISNGLSKIKTPEIILKVINYLTDNLDLLQRLELTQRQEFRYDDLVNNAAQAYLEQTQIEDHSILKSIISLVLKATQIYNYTLAYIFVKFFDITSTRFSTFEIFFNEFSNTPNESTNNKNHKRLLKFLTVLADIKCIDFFICKYKENPFPDEYIWFFYNSLHNFNKEVFEHFEKQINFISNNKFASKSVEELTKDKENRVKKDVNLLFSQSAFLAEINQIFLDIENPELTQEQLIDIKTNDYNNHKYSSLILEFLLDLTSKHEEDEPFFTPNTKVNKISLQEIQESKWNWDWIRISKLYDLFEKHNEVPLSDEQKRWVSEYCLSNMDKVDFKTALINETPDSASTSFLAVYLWYFLRKLNLEYPKNVLLDLLSFDWSEKTDGNSSLRHIGIDYLEEKLDIQEIKDRVLLNLQLGIRNTDVMNNHLKFCTKYKLRQVIPYIIHILANPPIYPAYFASSEHKTNHFINYHIRKSVLETIYEFKEISLLEKVLPNILDNFKWQIIDLIVEESEFCKEYLRKFLQNTPDKNEKLKAACYLIPFEEISALDYYVSYFEQGNEETYLVPQSTRFQYPLKSLEDSVSDSFAEKSIPLLMRLLKASYQPQYLTANSLTLNQTTLGLLERLAMKSDNFYSKIKASIETFITDNSEIPYVNNLHSFLHYVERNYYLNKAQSISVKEVVSKLNSLIYTEEIKHKVFNISMRSDI